MKSLHTLKAHLYRNALTKNPDDFIARVSSESSLGVADICRTAVNLWFKEMAYRLCDGFAVHTGWFNVSANIKGVFNSPNKAFNPKNIPKEVRKSFGQFFTSVSTASFMAGLFDVPCKGVIKALDPGAGSGILSAAIIEMIDKRYPAVNKVELTCYETNFDIILLLEANIEFMRRSTRLELAVTVKKENYILSQADDFSNPLPFAGREKYDMVISNPPYFKLPK